MVSARSGANVGFLLACIGTLLVGSSGWLVAQEDHLAAARKRASEAVKAYQGKVFRQRVVPNWQEGGRWMWYSVDSGPGQQEYIRVDLANGTRSMAFDHEQLAGLLSQQQGSRVQPTSLNLSGLVFSDDAATMEFQRLGKRWKWDLAKQEVVEVARKELQGAQIFTRARRSVSGGEETQLRITNKMDFPITCYWRGTDGNAVKYATVEPGRSFDQHTYVAHVWELRNTNDEVLVRIAAQEGEAEFVLDAGAIEAYKQLPFDRRPEGGRGEGPDLGRRRARPPASASNLIVRDHNLWWKGEADTKELPLSTDGTAEAPYSGDVIWSHDGKRGIVRQTTVVPARKITILEAAVPVAKEHVLDYNKPGDPLPHTRLSLLLVDQKKLLPIADELMKPQWSVGQIRWAADDSQVTCLFNQRGHQCVRLLRIDPSTGGVTTLVHETSKTFVDYAHKQYVHIDDQRKQVLWMTERSGWNHLVRIHSQSGEVLGNLTEGHWVVRGVEYLDEEKGEIWLAIGGYHAAEDPYYRHLARVRFDGTDFQVLTSGDGDHRWQFSTDRKWFVDTWSRVDHPPVSVLRRAEDGRQVCELERADWHALLETGWRVPERFVAKGRDGITDIHGIIVRPQNCEPSKKYPVIEQIYAGPQSAYVPKSFSTMSSLCELAELGFIVVQIDGMGTSHRSKAFHDVCWKNLADSGFPDRKLWLQAAAKKYSEMDIDRVGVYGGSAGGQNAMRAVLDHADVYKVAVADCGCHDNRLDKIWWNELWMSWPVDESYAQSSNLEHAGRLNGKLMLVVGEVDRNVDPVSTYATAGALVNAGKDFELVVMPGAGHGAGGSAYGKKRRDNFFNVHLRPELPSR